MKNKFIAATLAILLWGLGFHRFYLGKPWSGVLYLVFCFTLLPMIAWIVEGAFFLLQSKEDFDVQFNADYLMKKAAIRKWKNT